MTMRDHREILNMVAQSHAAAHRAMALSEATKLRLARAEIVVHQHRTKQTIAQAFTSDLKRQATA